MRRSVKKFARWRWAKDQVRALRRDQARGSGKSLSLAITLAYVAGILVTHRPAGKKRRGRRK